MGISQTFGVLLLASALNGDTLVDALARASVPTGGISNAELGTRIASYAVSEGNPFLIGYYTTATRLTSM